MIIDTFGRILLYLDNNIESTVLEKITETNELYKLRGKFEIVKKNTQAKNKINGNKD